MGNVGMRLAELRTKAGLTQEELAEALDYDRTYISRVETGARKPSAKFLIAFANYLKTSVGDLLREAGFLQTTEVDKDELVEMVAAYPDLAAVFEYARRTGDRGLLADLARQARLLILEKEQEDAEESGESS